MIFLFTDFGAAGIYAGQVKAVLQQRAPKEPVIDLLHDARRSTPGRARFSLLRSR